MSFWNYFVAEAYCLYGAGKDKKIKVCEANSIKQFFKDAENSKRIKWQIIKNPSYINRKPFCKSPGRMIWKKFPKCISKEQQKCCPFFGYVLVDREKFIAAVKAIESTPTKNKNRE